MKIWLCACVMMLVGCVQPQIVRLSPPVAFLQLPPRPTVPAEPVSNVDLVNYIYELHDDSERCRTQIDNIQQWMQTDD